MEIDEMKLADWLAYIKHIEGSIVTHWNVFAIVSLGVIAFSASATKAAGDTNTIAAVLSAYVIFAAGNLFRLTVVQRQYLHIENHVMQKLEGSESPDDFAVLEAMKKGRNASVEAVVFVYIVMAAAVTVAAYVVLT